MVALNNFINFVAMEFINKIELQGIVGNVVVNTRGNHLLLLQKINDLGTTVLVVTHEKELVNAFSKRVISIENGQVVRDRTGGYYEHEN